MITRTGGARVCVLPGIQVVLHATSKEQDLKLEELVKSKMDRLECCCACMAHQDVSSNNPDMDDEGRLSWEHVEKLCSNFSDEKWQLGDTIFEKGRIQGA